MRLSAADAQREAHPTHDDKTVVNRVPGSVRFKNGDETHNRFGSNHLRWFGIKNSVPRTSPIYVLLLMLACISTGCKRGNTLTDEDLRSELKSISSVASETRLLITQIDQQRVTAKFASGHIENLREQNDETLHDLTKASGSTGNDAILQQARAQATELSQQLDVLSHSVQNPPRDSASRIDQVLKNSQQLQASLR